MKKEIPVLKVGSIIRVFKIIGLSKFNSINRISRVTAAPNSLTNASVFKAKVPKIPFEVSFNLGYEDQYDVLFY